MEDPIKPIVDAAQLHDWYAVAALMITLSTQLMRKLPWLYEHFWKKIPDGWRWVVPVVKGALVGFVAAYANHQTFTQALLAAAGGAVGLGTPAMGLAAFLKESPAKWDGGAGGKVQSAVEAVETEEKSA